MPQMESFHVKILVDLRLESYTVLITYFMKDFYFITIDMELWK